MNWDYELEKELKRNIFTSSFYEFYKWSFNILEPQTKLEDAFYIKFLCDRVQVEIERIIRHEVKGKDLIINVPPRTSKSKIFSQSLLAWVWTKAPYLKQISVSWSDKLAISNAQYCKDIIRSEQYQELFGDIFQIRKDIDARERFGNDKGGLRLATTIGGTITGFGAEIIVVDDPQDPETAESEVEREKVKRYWKETLYNRLTPLNLGIRILVQQRLHVEDLTGHLLDVNPDAFEHICLPAELDTNIKPAHLAKKYVNGLLDAVRLNKVELDKLQKQGGDRYYVGQYGQRPVPKEGTIIKEDWFDIVDPYSLSREPVNEPIHFVLDTAYTEKTKNDATAILACFLKNTILYVLDVTAVRKEFAELCEFIVQYVGRFQYSEYSKIIIEPKASGKDIVSQLRSTTKLNVIEAPPPEKDKVTRTIAITPKLQARRVKLVNGLWISDTMTEWTSFPDGKHDDRVDALVMAVQEFLINDSPDFFFLNT